MSVILNYLELSLVDTKGKERIKISRLKDNPKLFRLNNEDFFRRTLISNRTENPVREVGQGRYVSVFTRSVVHSEFLGMIVLKLDTQSFDRALRPLLERDLQTFLFDDRGVVLAASLDSAESKSVLEKLNLGEKAAGIFEESSEALTENLLIGKKEALFSILPSGSFEQIGSVERQPGSNWFLGVFEPQPTTRVPLGFQVIFFSTLLLAIGGVLLATANAARRITIPLEKVSLATTQIARGQGDLNLNVKTGDEVEDLADAVARMNGELQDYQKRLVQSTKLATMGEMTSEISHEIQNRISGISLWLQHLDSEIDQDDPKREYLEEMKQGLAGFMEMLGSLKAYYQDPVLNLAEVDINLLVSDSIPFVREKLDEKRVVVNETFETDLPTVKGDSEKLKSVVLNLLINAADSLPEGGEINIKTQTTEADGVCLEIFDNGKGISEKELSRIFYPFFSTKSGGSGFGIVDLFKYNLGTQRKNRG